MTTRRTFTLALITLLALLALVACGGSAPATLADIPTYPGATELKPGEDPIGNTLAQNNQADAALRAQLGTGGKTDQKGFRLPSDAQWDQVKSFYDEKFKAAGWSTNNLVSGIMDQASQGSGFHTMNWQRGSQNVTVIMLTVPGADGDQQNLIVSLSSQ